jgi:hypothetical protein
MWTQQQQQRVLQQGWRQCLLVLLLQAGQAATAAMGCCLGSCLLNSRFPNPQQPTQQVQPRQLAPTRCRLLSLQQ